MRDGGADEEHVARPGEPVVGQVFGVDTAGRQEPRVLGPQNPRAKDAHRRLAPSIAALAAPSLYRLFRPSYLLDPGRRIASPANLAASGIWLRNAIRPAAVANYGAGHFPGVCLAQIKPVGCP